MKKVKDLTGSFACVKLFDDREVVYKGWGGFRKKGIPQSIGEVFAWHNPIDGKYPPTNFQVGTVKVLYIEKNKKLSLHFHLEKTELFYMVEGSLEVVLVADGIEEKVFFEKGDAMIIEPGMVHSMKGLEENNILLEVSTVDYKYDSYRIKKGD